MAGLYRLSQAGSEGDICKWSLFLAFRKMGHWAVRTALELHPQAKPEQEHICPVAADDFVSCENIGNLAAGWGQFRIIVLTDM